MDVATHALMPVASVSVLPPQAHCWNETMPPLPDDSVTAQWQHGRHGTAWETLPRHDEKLEKLTLQTYHGTAKDDRLPATGNASRARRDSLESLWMGVSKPGSSDAGSTCTTASTAVAADRVAAQNWRGTDLDSGSLNMPLALGVLNSLADTGKQPGGGLYPWSADASIIRSIMSSASNSADGDVERGVCTVPSPNVVTPLIPPGQGSNLKQESRGMGRTSHSIPRSSSGDAVPPASFAMPDRALVTLNERISFGACHLASASPPAMSTIATNAHPSLPLSQDPIMNRGKEAGDIASCDEKPSLENASASSGQDDQVELVHLGEGRGMDSRGGTDTNKMVNDCTGQTASNKHETGNVGQGVSAGQGTDASSGQYTIYAGGRGSDNSVGQSTGRGGSFRGSESHRFGGTDSQDHTNKGHSNVGHSDSKGVAPFGAFVANHFARHPRLRCLRRRHVSDMAELFLFRHDEALRGDGGKRLHAMLDEAAAVCWKAHSGIRAEELVPPMTVTEPACVAVLWTTVTEPAYGDKNGDKSGDWDADGQCAISKERAHQSEMFGNGCSRVQLLVTTGHAAEDVGPSPAVVDLGHTSECDGGQNGGVSAFGSTTLGNGTVNGGTVCPCPTADISAVGPRLETGGICPSGLEQGDAGRGGKDTCVADGSMQMVACAIVTEVSPVVPAPPAPPHPSSAAGWPKSTSSPCLGRLTSSPSVMTSASSYSSSSSSSLSSSDQLPRTVSDSAAIPCVMATMTGAGSHDGGATTNGDPVAAANNNNEYAGGATNSDYVGGGPTNSGLVVAANSSNHVGGAVVSDATCGLPAAILAHIEALQLVYFSRGWDDVDALLAPNAARLRRLRRRMTLAPATSSSAAADGPAAGPAAGLADGAAGLSSAEAQPFENRGMGGGREGVTGALASMFTRSSTSASSSISGSGGEGSSRPGSTGPPSPDAAPIPSPASPAVLPSVTPFPWGEGTVLAPSLCVRSPAAVDVSARLVSARSGPPETPGVGGQMGGGGDAAGFMGYGAGRHGSRRPVDPLPSDGNQEDTTDSQDILDAGHPEGTRDGLMDGDRGINLPTARRRDNSQPDVLLLSTARRRDNSLPDVLLLSTSRERGDLGQPRAGASAADEVASRGPSCGECGDVPLRADVVEQGIPERARASYASVTAGRASFLSSAPPGLASATGAVSITATVSAGAATRVISATSPAPCAAAAPSVAATSVNSSRSAPSSAARNPVSQMGTDWARLWRKLQGMVTSAAVLDVSVDRFFDMVSETAPCADADPSTDAAFSTDAAPSTSAASSTEASSDDDCGIVAGSADALHHDRQPPPAAPSRPDMIEKSGRGFAHDHNKQLRSQQPSNKQTSNKPPLPMLVMWSAHGRGVDPCARCHALLPVLERAGELLLGEVAVVRVLPSSASRLEQPNYGSPSKSYEQVWNSESYGTARGSAGSISGDGDIFARQPPTLVGGDNDNRDSKVLSNGASGNNSLSCRNSGCQGNNAGSGLSHQDGASGCNQSAEGSASSSSSSNGPDYNSGGDNRAVIIPASSSGHSTQQHPPPRALAFSCQNSWEHRSTLQVYGGGQCLGEMDWGGSEDGRACATAEDLVLFVRACGLGGKGSGSGKGLSGGQGKETGPGKVWVRDGREVASVNGGGLSFSLSNGSSHRAAGGRMTIPSQSCACAREEPRWGGGVGPAGGYATSSGSSSSGGGGRGHGMGGFSWWTSEWIGDDDDDDDDDGLSVGISDLAAAPAGLDAPITCIDGVAAVSTLEEPATITTTVQPPPQLDALSSAAGVAAEATAKGLPTRLQYKPNGRPINGNMGVTDFVDAREGAPNGIAMWPYNDRPGHIVTRWSYSGSPVVTPSAANIRLPERIHDAVIPREMLTDATPMEATLTEASSMHAAPRDIVGSIHDRVEAMPGVKEVRLQSSGTSAAPWEQEQCAGSTVVNRPPTWSETSKAGGPVREEASGAATCRDTPNWIKMLKMPWSAAHTSTDGLPWSCPRVTADGIVAPLHPRAMSPSCRHPRGLSTPCCHPGTMSMSCCARGPRLASPSTGLDDSKCGFNSSASDTSLSSYAATGEPKADAGCQHGGLRSQGRQRWLRSLGPRQATGEGDIVEPQPSSQPWCDAMSPIEDMGGAVCPPERKHNDACQHGACQRDGVSCPTDDKGRGDIHPIDIHFDRANCNEENRATSSSSSIGAEDGSGSWRRQRQQPPDEHASQSRAFIDRLEVAREIAMENAPEDGHSPCGPRSTAGGVAASCSHRVVDVGTKLGFLSLCGAGEGKNLASNCGAADGISLASQCTAVGGISLVGPCGSVEGIRLSTLHAGVDGISLPGLYRSVAERLADDTGAPETPRTEVARTGRQLVFPPCAFAPSCAPPSSCGDACRHRAINGDSPGGDAGPGHSSHAREGHACNHGDEVGSACCTSAASCGSSLGWHTCPQRHRSCDLCQQQRQRHHVCAGFLPPMPTPTMIFLGGGAGSGKTTVANVIAGTPFWEQRGEGVVVVECDAFLLHDPRYQQGVAGAAGMGARKGSALDKRVNDGLSGDKERREGRRGEHGGDEGEKEEEAGGMGDGQWAQEDEEDDDVEEECAAAGLCGTQLDGSGGGCTHQSGVCDSANVLHGIRTMHDINVSAEICLAPAGHGRPALDGAGVDRAGSEPVTAARSSTLLSSSSFSSSKSGRGASQPSLSSSSTSKALAASSWSSSASSPDINELHESAMATAQELLVVAVNQGRDVLFDGTMAWSPFIKQTIAMLRDGRHLYRRGPGYVRRRRDRRHEETYWVIDEEATAAALASIRAVRREARQRRRDASRARRDLAARAGNPAAACGRGATCNSSNAATCSNSAGAGARARAGVPPVDPLLYACCDAHASLRRPGRDGPGARYVRAVPPGGEKVETRGADYRGGRSCYGQGGGVCQAQGRGRWNAEEKGVVRLREHHRDGASPGPVVSGDENGDSGCLGPGRQGAAHALDKDAGFQASDGGCCPCLGRDRDGLSLYDNAGWSPDDEVGFLEDEGLWKNEGGCLVSEEDGFLEEAEEEEDEDYLDPATLVRPPYRVEMVGVTASPLVAVKRGLVRQLIVQRSVPLQALLRSHRLFSSHFLDYAALLDGAVLFENSSSAEAVVAAGGRPQLLAFKSAGQGSVSWALAGHSTDAVKPPTGGDASSSSGIRHLGHAPKAIGQLMADPAPGEPLAGHPAAVGPLAANLLCVEPLAGHSAGVGALGGSRAGIDEGVGGNAGVGAMAGVDGDGWSHVRGLVVCDAEAMQRFLRNRGINDDATGVDTLFRT